jgi:hypothetical protein
MAQDSEHQGASRIGVNEPFFSADYNTPISREQPFTGNTPLSPVTIMAAGRTQPESLNQPGC